MRMGKYWCRAMALLMAMQMFAGSGMTAYAETAGAARMEGTEAVYTDAGESDAIAPGDESPTGDPDGDTPTNPAQPGSADQPADESDDALKDENTDEPSDGDSDQTADGGGSDSEDDPDAEEEQGTDTETGTDIETGTDTETGTDQETQEDTELTEEEELTGSVLSEEFSVLSVTELAVPKNLKLDNVEPLVKRLTWDAVKGATGYEVYYAVDSQMLGDALPDDAYTLLGETNENTYEVDPSESEVLNPEQEYNHYPVEAQYYSYRVKAVYRPAESGAAVLAEDKEPESVSANAVDGAGENIVTGYSQDDGKVSSAFSAAVSANGMYADSLPYINSKRKAYKLPGTGDYVRFYLGDAQGTEYNEANPISLHVGEGIDGLTLWAVCEDGSKVSYCDIRDGIAAYEEAHEYFSGKYRHESEAATYGFTWAIANELSSADKAVGMGEGGCLSSFQKYAGNTVSNQLGLKAEKTTSGNMYLPVGLNNSLLPDTPKSSEDAMYFVFFVPIRIEEAEEGVVYDNLDQSDAICASGEELWEKARQKIHNRERNFALLLSEEAYNKFLDDYDYFTYVTDDDGESHQVRLNLADDKIVNTWLFTQYEEQEWMEPWAGDNLMDCMRRSSYNGEQILFNGTWYQGFQFSASYLTTAEQERILDEKINELLAEGGALHEAYVSGNDMKKIQAAYNYTKGIKWVNGLENDLNYTVYSGVVLRKGSCESSSLTFVRLCREMGVQARVVKDDYWGKAGDHAWNLVEYNGLWYYVDCTSGKFMKGSSAYNVNKQLELYRSKEFTDSHPISKSDYALKKVVYQLNGGTNAAGNPDTFEAGDTLTFAAPTRTGYTFGGWYADRAFKVQVTGAEGGSYDTASLGGNLTLYAKWSVNTYTLAYDLNIPGGAVIKTEAPVSNVTAAYDKAVKLAVNKCALYKYKFTGWNTEADGSGTAYRAGASVKNLTAEGTCTLYAQWAPTAYTVKYDSNASSVGLSARGRVANTTMTFCSDANATAANAFKIDGYQFVGWNTRADGRGMSLGATASEDGTVSGAAVIGTALETAYAKDTNASVVLYARWKAVPYTVKLYLNDGSAESGPAQTISMNIGETLSSKRETAHITRSGYKLASWNLQKNGKGRRYALNAKNLAKAGGEITLYAQWSKPVAYKITYDLQGGRNASKNPKTYTVASTDAQRTLLQPTKTGYTFKKWVDASSENPEDAPGIAVIPAATCRDIKLRAVWEENSYQVIYHGANETYTAKTDTVTKTYKYTEWADTFAPADAYSLKDGVEGKVSISAWTTRPNGKGKAYAVGKGFSKLSADPYDADTGKGSIDLYAKWSTAVYRITYENCSVNDGVKNSNAISYTYNAKRTVSVRKPTRTGYVFAGWTAPEGKEYFNAAKNQIVAGASENVILTANWTPITYAVKLNLNVKDAGVSFKTDAQTVYGNTGGTGIAYDIEESSFVTQDVVNIPEYYELTGWNTKSNGKGIAAGCGADAAGGSVASVNLAGLGTRDKCTVTLYAIWKPKTYSVTYKNVDPDNKTDEIVELTGVKESNPSTYTYSASRAVKLKNPTKYGFVFEGWYTGYQAATGTYTDKVTSIPKGSYGDIILYGKWRVK